MEEITMSAIIMAAPMLVMGACWIKSKYALYTLLVLTLAAVGIPVFKEIFALTELVSLIGYLGITEQLTLCVMSLVFAWTVASAGPRLRRTSWTAFLSGFLMGPLVAVFFMKQLVNKQEETEDRQALGRLCLLVLGGGCVAKAVSVPLLLMASNVSLLMLLPATGIFLFLSRVQQGDLKEEEAYIFPFSVAIGVFSISLFQPDFLIWVYVGAALLLAPIAIKKRQLISLKPILWGIGVLPISLIAVLGGGPELISWWLESIQVNYAQLLGPAMCGVGLLFSAVTDPVAAGVVGFSMMNNALDLKDPLLAQQLGIGIALGGISPVLLVGVASEVYKRLFLGLCSSLIAAQLLFWLF